MLLQLTEISGMYNVRYFCFLGAFKKSQKAAVSFFISGGLSVCLQVTTHLPFDGFSRNVIFEFLQKSVKKIHD
jgi:hypothetical protein